MKTGKITVQVYVDSNIEKVWEYYTHVEHITKWNFAAPSWHCPFVQNDLQIGGKYLARMEAKDNSFGFDFEAYYTDIVDGETFTYEFGGRYATSTLKVVNGQTEVTVTFDAEAENPIEFQKLGWQSILNNFKKYIENN